MAAKASKLQQFKASFNAFQFEIANQNQSSPKMVKQESFSVRQVDTGLESLVKALQEEAVVVKAELAQWMNKATSSAQETAALKEDSDKRVASLMAEVEGWRDRAAMSAGKGIVARRQLEDYAKQVKSLSTELQEWKEEALKAQKENEELRTEVDEWKLEADALAKEVVNLKSEVSSSIAVLQADTEKWKHISSSRSDSIQVLEADLERWKQKATSRIDEDGPHTGERQVFVRDLRANVDEWGKGVTSGRMDADSPSSISECMSNEWRDRNSGLEASSQAEIEELKRQVVSVEEERSELEACLQSQIEDLKQKIFCAEKEHSKLEVSFKVEIEELKKKLVVAEKERSELEVSLKLELQEFQKKVVAAEMEQEQLKQRHESQVKELEAEVEEWMSAASVTEHEKLERLEIEKKLKDSQLKARRALEDLSHERKRSAVQMAELQAQVKDWKVVAADSSEECSSLRVAFDSVVQELHLELSKWKQKTEACTEEGKLVTAELSQWKQKAETSDDELKLVKAELEKVAADLQNQVLLWKEKAENVSKEMAKNQECANLVQILENELSLWKQKAKDFREEGQVMRAETAETVEDLQKQVLLWKEKAESALDGAAKSQEYAELVRNLEYEISLWKQRNQEGQSLLIELEEEQMQLMDSLTDTQSELQRWKERAAAAARAVRPMQDDSSDISEANDEDDVDSLSVLQSELVKWKARAQEGELLQSQLKNAIAVTQKELNEWKQKAAAVTLATESLKEELDCVIEEGKAEREDLYNSINDLEEALFIWQERAQECQLLQTQLKNSQTELNECKDQLKTSQAELKEWKEKAVAITLTTKSLMEELDFRIEEGLQEKQEFCKAISNLKESVLGWKDKAAESESMIKELKSALLETQTALRDWKDRATNVAMATDALKGQMDSTLEGYRLEKEELCNTINELEADVYEWKARAQDGMQVQRQLEKALAELEKKKRPLLRAHRSSSISS